MPDTIQIPPLSGLGNVQLQQMLSQLPNPGTYTTAQLPQDSGAPSPTVPGGGGGGALPTLSDTVTGLGPPSFDTPYATAGDVQKAILPQIHDLLTQLQQSTDPATPANQSLTQQLKSLTYTPEQRAQDMYDKLMGIKTVPGKTQISLAGNNAEGMPQIGLQTGEPATKRNWLKSILGSAGEFGLSLRQGENYHPAMERFRDEATKEYTAEAIPAMRDLLYETQNRRNLLNSADSLFRTYGESQAADARIHVSQARAVADNYAKSILTPSLVNQHNAEVNRILAETDQNQQKIDMDKEALRMKEITGGQSGPLGAANERTYLAKTQGDAAANQMWKQYMEGLQMQAQGRWPPTVENVNGHLMVLNRQTRALEPITYGDLQNATGGEEAVTPELQKQVKDYYSQGTPNAPVYFGSIHYNQPYPSQMSQYERAVVGSEPLEETPKGRELTAMDSAIQGYRAINSMKQVVASLNPNDLGTFAGLFNKILANHTTEADPAWTKLFANAQVAAAAHTAVQSFRNAGYADQISKLLTPIQTNPKAMNAALNSFEGTFLPTIQAHKGYFKAQSFVKDLPPDEVMRIVHPDLYSKYIQRTYNDGKNMGLVK